MNADQPKLISGGQFSDERGQLWFVNDFPLDDIKRFYIIKHPDSHIIRAWQAHKEEIKYFYVLKGSFEIKLVKIFNWQTPKSSSTILDYKLSEIDNSVLKVPMGFANGFINLEPNSELMIFSTSTLEESKNDDYRYDKGHFENCNWEI